MSAFTEEKICHQTVSDTGKWAGLAGGSKLYKSLEGFTTKMIRVHRVNILRLFNAVSFFGYHTLISKAGQHILRARFVNIKAVWDYCSRWNQWKTTSIIGRNFLRRSTWAAEPFLFYLPYRDINEMKKRSSETFLRGDTLVLCVLFLSFSCELSSVWVCLFNLQWKKKRGKAYTRPPLVYKSISCPGALQLEFSHRKLKLRGQAVEGAE